MRNAAVTMALVGMLAACATDAPEGPSPYPPTVKPAQSKLLFSGAETCTDLRSKYDNAKDSEAYLAKHLAVQHHELPLMTILTLGAMPFAFDKDTKSLAEARGDLLAIHAEMSKRPCETVPEVVFSTPSARTPGSLYH